MTVSSLLLRPSPSSRPLLFAQPRLCTIALVVVVVVLLPACFTTVANAAAVDPSHIPLTTAPFRFFGPLPLTSSSHGANPLAALHTSLLPTLRNLSTFPSEAAVGGHAKWRPAAPLNLSHPATVTARFDDAATPYEAFALASFTVPRPSKKTKNSNRASSRIVVICDAPLAIHPASSSSSSSASAIQRCPARDPDQPRSVCPLDLSPGVYTAIVHVRSGARDASFTCAHFLAPSPAAPPPALLSLGHVVAPAVVVQVAHPVNHTRLAGNYVSFTLQNLHRHAWARAGRVALHSPPPGIRIAESSFRQPDIAPQQAVALRVQLVADDKLLAPSTPFDLPEPRDVVLTLVARFRLRPADDGDSERERSAAELGEDGKDVSVMQNITLPVKTWPPHAYTFTFRDIDGSVQAAAAVVPARPCAECPPVLSTHGAGVDATARAWTESYRSQNGSWVILPTGRRRYGLNWHGPQLLSAMSALTAFERELPGVPVALRNKWRPRRDAWLAAGHSMGGHGALVLATHYPDALVAALPAMAWLRLDQYGSGAKKEDMTFADSALRSLLTVASAEWNTDMYAENLLGIPFLARVGGADENVPPTNLRRFVRLLYENELHHNMSSVVGLSEIPGKGHWFDGVVDDDILQPFFDKHLKPGPKPALPKQFSVFTMNPASSGSRGGLQILLTDVPFEEARLRVSRDDPRTGAWYITATNVQRFRYIPVSGIEQRPSEFVLGDRGARGIRIDVDALARNRDYIDMCAQPSPQWGGPPAHGGRPVSWRRCTDHRIFGSARSDTRAPDTAGPAARVLSGRRVVIVYPRGDLALRALAVQYTNALFGEGIDAEVIGDDEAPPAGDGTNLVLLGTLAQNHAMRYYARVGSAADVSLRATGTICVGGARCFATPGTGVTFLAGGPARSLLLYVTGVDAEGVLSAAEFLPYSPASGVPEWIVVSARRGLGFRGLGGVLAAGYWDVRWKLESRRVYPGDFALPGVADAQSCAAAVGSRASRNVLAVIVVCGILGAVFVLVRKSRQRYDVVGEDEVTQLVEGAEPPVQAKRPGAKGKKATQEEVEGLMLAEETARRSGGVRNNSDEDEDDVGRTQAR